MKRRWVPLVHVLATLSLLSACERGGCVRTTGDTALLAQPYPENYPSTHPLPNRRLATLPPGTYRYRRAVIGKDYMVYEVAAPGIGTGFVVGDNSNQECGRPGGR
jgi:hypothetical protein